MTHLASLPLSLAAAGTSAVALTAWAVLNPRSALWGPVVWRGPRTAPRVALTFDDGPHPEGTPSVLEALGEAGVSATFFVIGRQAARWPELVKRIANEGHVVGNHTWDHHHYGCLGGVRYWKNQLEQTDRLVADLTGRAPRTFRPPFGFRTWHLYRALRETGHTVVNYSLRGMDGIKTSAGRVSERILGRAAAGDIIALHDGRDPHVDAPRDAARTALPEILRGLRERGLAASPLEAFLELEAPAREAVLR